MLRATRPRRLNASFMSRYRLCYVDKQGNGLIPSRRNARVSATTGEVIVQSQAVPAVLARARIVTK